MFQLVIMSDDPDSSDDSFTTALSHIGDLEDSEGSFHQDAHECSNSNEDNESACSSDASETHSSSGHILLVGNNEELDSLEQLLEQTPLCIFCALKLGVFQVEEVDDSKCPVCGRPRIVAKVLDLRDSIPINEKKIETEKNGNRIKEETDSSEFQYMKENKCDAQISHHLREGEARDLASGILPQYQRKRDRYGSTGSYLWRPRYFQGPKTSPKVKILTGWGEKMLLPDNPQFIPLETPNLFSSPPISQEPEWEIDTEENEEHVFKEKPKNTSSDEILKSEETDKISEPNVRKHRTRLEYYQNTDSRYQNPELRYENKPYGERHGGFGSPDRRYERNEHFRSSEQAYGERLTVTHPTRNRGELWDPTLGLEEAPRRGRSRPTASAYGDRSPTTSTGIRSYNRKTHPHMAPSAHFSPYKGRTRDSAVTCFRPLNPRRSTSRQRYSRSSSLSASKSPSLSKLLMRPESPSFSKISCDERSDVYLNSQFKVERNKHQRHSKNSRSRRRNREARTTGTWDKENDWNLERCSQQDSDEYVSPQQLRNEQHRSYRRPLFHYSDAPPRRRNNSRRMSRDSYSSVATYMKNAFSGPLAQKSQRNRKRTSHHEIAPGKTSESLLNKRSTGYRSFHSASRRSPGSLAAGWLPPTPSASENPSSSDCELSHRSAVFPSLPSLSPHKNVKLRSVITKPPVKNSCDFDDDMNPLRQYARLRRNETSRADVKSKHAAPRFTQTKKVAGRSVKAACSDVTSEKSRGAFAEKEQTRATHEIKRSCSRQPRKNSNAKSDTEREDSRNQSDVISSSNGEHSSPKD